MQVQEILSGRSYEERKTEGGGIIFAVSVSAPFFSPFYATTLQTSLVPRGRRGTWSWNMAPPKAQTAAKTK